MSNVITYGIKVLKSTPFDHVTTILTFEQFRAKYGYWVKDKSDSEIRSLLYIPVPGAYGSSVDISYWFGIVEIPAPEPELPNDFIYLGLLYRKGFDGMYGMYHPTVPHEKQMRIGQIHIGEARAIFNSAKYKSQVWFITHDVNAKI